mmetsp:Transcript_13755/g.30195  ORF Transcript_13755/g.30195 Transcript_13755/m.30195 type:complete len:293 (-) Transcript_13755:150-1028(-)
MRSSMYFSSIRRNWSSSTLLPSRSSSSSRSLAALLRAMMSAFSAAAACSLPETRSCSASRSLCAPSCLRCSTSFSMCPLSIRIFFCSATTSLSARYLYSFSMRMRSFICVTLARRFLTSFRPLLTAPAPVVDAVRVLFLEPIVRASETIEPPSREKLLRCIRRIFTHCAIVKSRSCSSGQVSVARQKATNSSLRGEGHVSGDRDSASLSCSFNLSHFFFNISTSAPLSDGLDSALSCSLSFFRPSACCSRSHARLLDALSDARSPSISLCMDSIFPFTFCRSCSSSWSCEPS